MFKKLSLVLAALIVGSFAFAEKTADGGAKPAAAGSVSANWEWKSIPKSKIGTDAMTFKKQVVLAPVDGSKGAQFALERGEVKFKTEDYTALYHSTKPDGSAEKVATNKQYQKSEFSITIDDAATIKFTLAGNGTKGKTRAAILATRVLDDKGAAVYTPIVDVENLGDDGFEELVYANAPAGTYYLVGNGHRIVKVEAKN